MNELPTISIRVDGSMHPAECVELAKAAEAAGLTGVWFAENAFARGILPAATACALATEKIRINAGVFNPFSRHPTMMAMEIGALDEISNGRTSHQRRRRHRVGDRAPRIERRQAAARAPRHARHRARTA